MLNDRNNAASKKLAERFDALNQAIAVAEQKLKELKPPHSVWVHYNHSEDRGNPSAISICYEVLGMTKIANQWRLSHAYDHDLNEDGPTGIQPLSECPVEIRVRAVSHLSSLQSRIVEIKEAFIPEVEKALTSVLDFCQGGGA